MEGAGQHSPACRTFKVPWGLDWVIVGAQSGFRPRPMDEAWVRRLRDQCVSTGTKFFFKQAMRDGQLVSLPELDGRKWAEFPVA
jgi:protein gp37